MSCPQPGPQTQPSWLQYRGGSPVCLESLGSIMPVGVGGVMMMLGTSRCLSLRTGASSRPLLLTHILKPERAGRGTHVHTRQRDKHEWPPGHAHRRLPASLPTQSEESC